MDNVFENFYWHSAIGMDEELNVNKNFAVKMANTDENIGNFHPPQPLHGKGRGGEAPDVFGIECRCLSLIGLNDLPVIAHVIQ